MKNRQYKGPEGYTLIELMIVIAIIGVLASIAIPNYLKSRQKAYDAACLANRRNIEIDVTFDLANNNMPSLHIDEKYSCPLGGIYVWLTTDPEELEYAEVACSVHYAGSATLPDQPNDGSLDSPPEDTDDSEDLPLDDTPDPLPDDTPDPLPDDTPDPPPDDTPDPLPEDTPDPPPQEVDEPVSSPVDALEVLIVAVEALNLPGNGKNGADKMIKKLEDALKEVGKGKIPQAEKKLSDFKKELEKNKKIAPNDKSALLGMAEDIQILF